MSKELRALAEAWRDCKLNNMHSTVEHIGMLFVHKRNFEQAVTPDAVIGLIDRLDRQENLLREQLTICRYLSKSICMTDETGDDTNPDNIVE